MNADIQPFDVMRHTFWFGEAPAEADPRMQRVAECVAALRPAIQAAAEVHGERRTMWALLAILVHMAIDRGDGLVVAAMMRTNARIIELEAGTTLLGFDP